MEEVKSYRAAAGRYAQAVQSGKLDLNSGGTLFLDPSYKSFTSLGNPLAGNAIVASGSVLAIGQIDDLEAHVSKAGLSTSAVWSANSRCNWRMPARLE